MIHPNSPVLSTKPHSRCFPRSPRQCRFFQRLCWARRLKIPCFRYSKRLDYRHAFVSTFCGTFGVDFTDEGGPRGSGILHFDFFLCEGYSRIGDPRVAMAYRAWQLAKRVNAL